MNEPTRGDAVLVMKTLIIFLIFTACSGSSAPKQPNYGVTLMFEVDGVRVYKFWDYGSHYFITRGETISTPSQTRRKEYTEKNIL